jgi:peptidoglycan/xylan/chitin deacetylase (PgdA/CDA1 family)
MATSIPILTFHALDDQPLVISFPPQLFQHGMDRLYAHGYRTLNLVELATYLRTGQPLPEKSFEVTFDDGYQSVYDHAFPVLQRYGFSATVFLTTGATATRTEALRLPSLNGRFMLSWGEIKEMYRWGIQFGAHTLTHPDLTRLPYERVEAEISGSQQIIEDALGAPVPRFAYPYGRYNSHSREIVRRRFTCACSDKLGLAHKSSDPFSLERVDAYYLRSERLFNVVPTWFFPCYIRARNLPRQIRRSRRFR